jgi:hypothetical protein
METNINMHCMAKAGVPVCRSSKKQGKWTINGRFGKFHCPHNIYYRTLKLGNFSDYRLSEPQKTKDGQL